MILYSATEFSSRLRVTIQSTGRLSFTEDTAKALSLCEGKCFKIAKEDVDDDQLFLVCYDGDAYDAFKARKSGVYYYLPTAALFDALGIDYSSAIPFALVRVPSYDASLRGKVYKMVNKDKKLRK